MGLEGSSITRPPFFDGNNYSFWKTRMTIFLQSLDYQFISVMFTRFTTIINSLKNLGKSYTNQEIVRKILRCLPKSWTPKVTAIEEAKDLSNLPLEQLLGSLMTHETTMKNHENVEVKKKKTIALKALREESERDEDDDIILISKQFKKFLKSQKGKKAFKKKVSQDEESSKREEPTCFECKKPGHFKNECPYLKKKEKFNKEHFKKKNAQSKKKKAMVATWDDIDPSSSKEEESNEEVVNLALMAMEEDTSGDESESEVNFTFDELQNAYEKLYIEYENICLKNKTLKKNAMSISKEIDDLKNKNRKYLNEIDSLQSKNSFYENEIEILNVSSKLSIDFMEENEKLKNEIEALKKYISTFSNSSDKLDNLIGLQRCVFDKAGLGYEQMKNVKHFKNLFVKKVEPQIACNYCGRIGHVSTSCKYRNNFCYGKTRKVWVPKGTFVTNLKGPKFKWVPKT
ncbi:zf-CCHC domain-containing protein/DUF4219 domain-containing protein/UBN2 domain-containing protein [Cephalotus follicularis]|uniref:Zf-CCHC domain-containing protein/DUF4219 domain-containing protein/UBN2 domain-containing protein n=1 Tax=Cephalotus follicularis TaxID=3775 RepID=A0A1Q3D7L6_CEPFO|nr:zf-CCHC domain-containing protein/DUF4219 domain-containing protein/UBN2 domain-containing protein [Cephalotus follicularis]